MTIDPQLKSVLDQIKVALCAAILAFITFEVSAANRLQAEGEDQFRYQIFKTDQQRTNLVEMLFSDMASNLLDDPTKFMKHYKAQQKKYGLPLLGKSKYLKAQSDAVNLLINAGKHYAEKMKQHNYSSAQALAKLPEDERAVILKVNLKADYLQKVEKKLHTLAIYNQVSEALSAGKFDQLRTGWPLASIGVRGTRNEVYRYYKLHSYSFAEYIVASTVSMLDVPLNPRELARKKNKLVNKSSSSSSPRRVSAKSKAITSTITGRTTDSHATTNSTTAISVYPTTAPSSYPARPSVTTSSIQPASVLSSTPAKPPTTTNSIQLTTALLSKPTQSPTTLDSNTHPNNRSTAEPTGAEASLLVATISTSLPEITAQAVPEIRPYSTTSLLKTTAATIVATDSSFFRSTPPPASTTSLLTPAQLAIVTETPAKPLSSTVLSKRKETVIPLKEGIKKKPYLLNKRKHSKKNHIATSTNLANGPSSKSGPRIDTTSAYTTLGLGGGSSLSEARKQYLTLLKKHHPDKLVNPSSEELTKAHQITIALNKAWQTLKEASTPRASSNSTNFKEDSGIQENSTQGNNFARIQPESKTVPKDQAGALYGSGVSTSLLNVKTFSMSHHAALMRSIQTGQMPGNTYAVENLANGHLLASHEVGYIPTSLAHTNEGNTYSYAQLYKLRMNQSTTRSSSGFDADGYGLETGIFQQLTPDWSVGFMFGFNHMTSSLKNHAGNNRAESFRVGPFASLYTGNWHLDLALTYGWSDLDSKRLDFVSAETGRAHFNIHDWILHSSLYYDITLNNLIPSLTLTPGVETLYTSSHQNSAKEKGSSNRLIQASAVNRREWVSRTGLQASYLISDDKQLRTIKGGAGYQRNQFDNSDIHAGFSPSNMQQLKPANYDRNSTFYNLGFSTSLVNRHKLSFDYSGFKSKNSRGDSLSISYDMKF